MQAPHNLLILQLEVGLNRARWAPGAAAAGALPRLGDPPLPEGAAAGCSPAVRLFTGSGFLEEVLLTIFQLLFKGFYDQLKEGTTKLYCGPLNHRKWASNDNSDSSFKSMKLLICLSL